MRKTAKSSLGASFAVSLSVLGRLCVRDHCVTERVCRGCSWVIRSGERSMLEIQIWEVVSAPLVFKALRLEKSIPRVSTDRKEVQALGPRASQHYEFLWKKRNWARRRRSGPAS